MKSRHLKRKTRYEFAFGEAGKITAHGGQILVDAMARRLRLWERIKGLPGLDPRKRKSSGFDPEALAAQINRSWEIFIVKRGWRVIAWRN